MSIKGKWQELFIGKQSVSIQDWMYNKKTIQYNDMTRVEYCFRTMTEGGYIDFHDSHGHFERFSFPIKSNDAIQKTVDYINNHYPELEPEKHDIGSDPFYSKNVFIGVLSLFCSWPIGIILYWCTGKRTVKERVLFTTLLLLFHLIALILLYWFAQMQMNSFASEMNDYLNQINGIFQ